MHRRAYLGLCSATIAGGCIGSNASADSGPRVHCRNSTRSASADGSGPTGGIWPTFQYDMQNTGYAPELSGPDGCVRKRWQYQVNDEIYSSPVVAGRTLYIGSVHENVLNAVDIETGERQWKYTTRAAPIFTPTLSGRTMYLPNGPFVQAIDVHTQRELWHYECPNSTETTHVVSSAPRLANGWVYFGSQDGTVYALDAKNGEERWQFSAPVVRGYSQRTDAPGFEGAVAVADSTIFAGCEDHHLYALDAETGRKRWRFEVNGVIDAAPTVADGRVYVPSEGGRLYVLSISDGTVEWTFERGTSVGTSPAIAGGTAYVTTGPSAESVYLYALDATNGQVDWKTGMGIPESGPVVAGGTVYIGDQNRTFGAIDAETGEVRWWLGTTTTVWSSAAVIDGAVYISDVNGYVYGLW